MDGDTTPEFAIGALSADTDPVALLVRSRPTVYIKPDSVPDRYSYSLNKSLSGNPHIPSQNQTETLDIFKLIFLGMFYIIFLHF